MASIRRPLALQVIHSFVPELTSINQAIRLLKAEGLSYHNQTMRRDIGTILRGFRNRETRSATWVRSEPKPLEHIVEDWSMRPDRRYRSWGWAEFYDSETDSVVRRYVSFYHDYNLSDQDLVDQFNHVFSRREDYYFQTMLEFTAEDIHHNPNMSHLTPYA